jgi:hypothetical protein
MLLRFIVILLITAFRITYLFFDTKNSPTNLVDEAMAVTTEGGSVGAPNFFTAVTVLAENATAALEKSSEFMCLHSSKKSIAAAAAEFVDAAAVVVIRVSHKLTNWYSLFL